MDISLLCRGCMKEMETGELESHNEKITEMFCYCTKIKLKSTLDDKIPKQFCYKCITAIELCYKFIKEARKVDIELKNHIVRSTTVIVNPVNLKQDHNHIKLTLPDCKMSATINNDYKISDAIDDEEYENDFDEKADSSKDIQETEFFKEITYGPKKYACPVCRKCFTSKIWYNRHIEKENGSKFRCPHCNKTFLKSSQLSYHIETHCQEQRFGCNTCGKKFKRRKQLVVHTHTHSDIRPYGCDKCEMRFKKKSILKCHMKVHDDRKQYLCPICGWGFAQAGNLQVHMRKHTGDKPFKCGQCPFEAAAGSNLRRHERMHNGAKTHVCHHCRKGFYDAGSLARHRRTHTGELPYKCPGCERSFADSWKRKTHLMRAHQFQLQDIPRMTRDGNTIET